MHLDDIIPNVVDGIQENMLPVGCSTIICNQPGHVRMITNQNRLVLLLKNKRFQDEISRSRISHCLNIKHNDDI